MHLAAARTATDAHSRNRCLLDAASAAVDGGRRDAAALAARARRVAAALRNPVHEGRAVHIQRTILLRSGRATAPDREFVDAFCLLGVPGLAASAALTEAAIAWRLRDAGATRELAMTAAGSWGESPRGDAARALAAAAGEPLDDATLRRCQDSASHRLPPAVGAQALALLCLARPHWRDSLRAARAALRIPRQIRDRGAIREILCLAEADAILRDESDESQHRRCSARATPCADAPGRRVPSSADPP